MEKDSMADAMVQGSSLLAWREKNKSSERAVTLTTEILKSIAWKKGENKISQFSNVVAWSVEKLRAETFTCQVHPKVTNINLRSFVATKSHALVTFDSFGSSVICFY